MEQQNNPCPVHEGLSEDDYGRAYAKKKIGYPVKSAKLPRCPAKSRSKVKSFEAKGDFSHSDVKHFCHECACNRVAGWGTIHYGWGWCKSHEKGMRKSKAGQFAESHLQALQQRHPFSYRDAERWVDQVQVESDDAMAVLNLRAEIDVIRASLQEILSKCRVDTKEARQYADHIESMCEAIKAGGIDPDNSEQLLKLLKEISQKLDGLLIPLTESSGRGPVPVSDVTRIEMVRKLAETIARISKNKFDIDRNKFITVDELKVFVGMIVAATKRTVKDPAVFGDWAEAMAKIPSPRVMGSQTTQKDAEDL